MVKHFTKQNDTVRINKYIRAQEVRVIDDDGQMLGVMLLEEALNMAEEKGVDLVEVNPNSVPPVCKVLDYGKYRYIQHKKQQESKKKQSFTVIKELYVHLAIGVHDYQVKLKQLQSFLHSGYKVKVAVKLRGRERNYSDKAIELLNRFYEDIGGEEGSKLEKEPKVEGRNVVAVFTSVVAH